MYASWTRVLLRRRRRGVQAETAARLVGRLADPVRNINRLLELFFLHLVPTTQLHHWRINTFSRGLPWYSDCGPPWKGDGWHRFLSACNIQGSQWIFRVKEMNKHLLQQQVRIFEVVADPPHCTRNFFLNNFTPAGPVRNSQFPRPIWEAMEFRQPILWLQQ